MHTVKLTDNQFNLLQDLIWKHYDLITDGYWNQENDVEKAKELQSNAYKTMIALRLSKANKAWKEYIHKYPDAEWRAYPTKEEFLKDQYTIYPEDLK